MNKLSISPPWYTLRNELNYTIGDNPIVTVSELITVSPQNYKINIFACDYTTANGLRSILPEMYNFGSVFVYLYVYQAPNLLITKQPKSDYTPNEIGYLFKTALNSNNLFKKVILPFSIPFNLFDVVVVVKKKVIQFYNDNLEDFYLNFNEVASKVFKDIAITNFPQNVNVSFSTECDNVNNLK